MGVYYHSCVAGSIQPAKHPASSVKVFHWVKTFYPSDKNYVFAKMCTRHTTILKCVTVLFLQVWFCAR